MRRCLIPLWILILTVIFAGCSAKTIIKREYTETALPDELAKAFSVSEFKTSDAQTAAPAEGAAASKPAKKSKSAKAKKSKSIMGDAGKSFVIPNRRPAKDPLWVGEKIWMDVSWLNTTAGEFLLEVNPFKELNNRKVYDVKGSAKTSSLFSLIYKAEDWVQTFIDYEGWFPYKFILHGDETRYLRSNLELFDHAAKKQFVSVYAKRLDNDQIKDEKGYKDLVPFSQDSLSALYYARTQNLEPGQEVRFPMSTQGKQWETSLVVLAREEVKTKMGYIKAIKTKVETRFNGVLQQRGDSHIWFSDDDRKFVLKFEAKVKIGWVEGVATKIELGVPPLGEEAATTVVPLTSDTSSGVSKKGFFRRLWN